MNSIRTSLLRSNLSQGIRCATRRNDLLFCAQLNRTYATAPTASTAESSLILTKDIPAPHVGNIRLLLLNRPSAKNALSRDLLALLRTHIDNVAAEGGRGETRCLVIGSTDVGSNGVFCAGADLKERKTFTPQETTTFLYHLNTTLATLSSLQIPTISAIPAHAHGGGLELALCTDFRVTTPSAALSLPETRLGIIPGAGGTHRLPLVISRSRSLDMILTGRRINATEALGWGLVDRVAGEGEDVNDAAIKLAENICEGGPLAVVAGKKAVKVGLDGGVAVEGLAYAGVVETEDKYEALKAFGEKRKAVFKGK